MIHPFNLHTAILIFLAATIAVFSQTSDSTASVKTDTLLPAITGDTATIPPNSANNTAIIITETATTTNDVPGKMTIPNLKPLTIDSSGRGDLHIKVYPKNASVFLNSQHAGDGSRTVKNLQTGIYSLDLVYEFDTLTDLIKIEIGKTTELDLSVGKSTQFSIETSFGMLTFNKNINFGPAVDLGVQYRNNYFGIDYYWGFGDFYTFGGAALKYRKAVYNSKTVKIAPEVAAGFWYAQDDSYYYDNYGYHERYSDGMFFGGPGCSFKFGYKWVFFNVESIFLIGTSVSHLLKTGFCVFF